MNMWAKQKERGFTIVELLIVIVVVAILAVITIVAFNGIQQRARDSRRQSDLKSIQELLALYKADNGSYPPSTPNPGNSTWEISTDPGFLSSLNAYTNTTFKDPINSTSVYSYWYHTFSAGDYGCPVSAGPYYVLWAAMETQSSPNLQPGLCPGQTLLTSPNNYDYVVWGF